MDVFAFIFYLFTTFKIIMFKASNYLASIQETNEKPFCSFLNNFKQPYSTHIKELMGILYCEKFVESSCCSDLIIKQFESYFSPSEELKKVFQENKVEIIENANELAVKIDDANKKWNEFLNTLKNLSPHHNKKTEASDVFELLLNIKNSILLYASNILSCCFTYVENKCNRYFDYEQKGDESKIICDLQEHTMKFHENIQYDMTDLEKKCENHYDEIKDVVISVKCLNYNIFSLLCNLSDDFFRNLRSEADIYKFEEKVVEIILLLSEQVDSFHIDFFTQAP